MSTATRDFSGLHAAMRAAVAGELLAGVSSAVLIGHEVVDQHCTGWADRERGEALRPDHLFRMFSSTKLIASCAALMLVDEGRVALDAPIEEHLPQLARRRVLRLGATSLEDTEPARRSITLRHLLCHGSGLGYGLLDPGTLLYQAFIDHKVRDETTPLSVMMDRLEPLPLYFHPGESWAYSIASDVLGRLVEVVSGQAFDVFLRERIFGPLGMHDTGFVVPPGGADRLVAHYRGASLNRPLKPGLTRMENVPWRGAHLTPVPRLSGGGGLVSTLPDTIAFIRSLMPGGPHLLAPETQAMMMRNHLAEGAYAGFPGPIPGKGYGLGGAVTLAEAPGDPPDSVDEFQWGGMAGTHWWINPRRGIAGVVMAQRDIAFWHPFSFEMKRAAYAALG
ncbi:MAG: serine hydrolase domain-containing protein [Burkholderiales bacterium]